MNGQLFYSITPRKAGVFSSAIVVLISPIRRVCTQDIFMSHEQASTSADALSAKI
jgi:hypothetical protein